MANTIDTIGGPETLLRAIVDGTLSELVDENITAVGLYRLRDCLSLSDVSLPNCIALHTGSFITDIALETVYVPNADTVYLNSDALFGMASEHQSQTHPLMSVALPALINNRQNIATWRKGLKAVDIGPGATGFSNQCFDNCSDFETLILRKTSSVVPLGQDPFRWTFRSTKFASGGVHSTFLHPLSRLTNLLRTGLHSLVMETRSFLSRAASTSITTPTELLSSNRKGVMMYG